MHRIVSHYRIVERLAAGGMGEVYLAEDLDLHRNVALKLLPFELTREEEAREQLITEARLAASLNHPNIASIYELGQDGDVSFIAMEYVEGETVADRLSRGPLDINAAIQIASQIANALQTAHRAGVVHGDIKSTNVMLTTDESVKILDFGLASRTADSAELSAAGKGAPAHGTLHSMSPEQLRGEKTDERTDIFSFGVLLYEMIAGRKPFDGDRPVALREAILADEPEPLGAFRDDVPLELENIVRKSLEKNRADRYQTAADLLSDLTIFRRRQDGVSLQSQAAVVEPVISSTRSSFSAGFSKRLFSARRHRKWLLVIGVVTAGAALIDVIALQRQTDLPLVAIILSFLSTVSFLCFALLQRLVAEPAGLMPPARAFRGLLPFQEIDHDRFYGREIETLALTELIAHGDYRFGVLYGDSGAGKTSIIRAGLMPALRSRRYQTIYCRSYKGPQTSLLEECRKLKQAGPIDEATLLESLGRIAANNEGGVVVVFDQFEEFFVNFSTRKKREPFLSFLESCWAAADLDVKFLFSIRSDFLYLVISEFDHRLSGPFGMAKRFHLRSFDADQAEEIIKRSAERANLPFEKELCRQVARDLAVSDAVLPSELQVVGEQLQNRRIYTLEAYRRSGGREQLVHNYLDEVIQSTGDAVTARLMLRSLISDENTRLTLSLEEIAKRTQRNRRTVERIIRLFAQARLVREIQDETPWRYELIHEYLIERINQITGRVMDATQRANRLLRQYLSNHLIDRRTRIPLSKLWIIKRYSDLDRGDRERELLGKSLRSGLIKSTALLLLVLLGITLMAATLSVNETWDSVRLSTGHRAGALRAVFSPDGRLLATSSEDGTALVWDFARREVLTTLPDHSGRVAGLCFSPDGKWLATGCDNGTVTVWGSTQFEKVVVLRENPEIIGGLTFSPDSGLLACSGDNPPRTVVWRVGQWEKVRELETSVGNWGTLFFSKDSRRIVDAHGFWDLDSGQNVIALEMGTSLDLSPDGRLAVGIDGSGYVRFVDLQRRRLITLKRTQFFHGRATVFSPDGQIVATASEDIVLWDASSQEVLARFVHEADVWALTFSPNGKWLVSTHSNGAVVLWDVRERKRVADFNEHGAPVRAVAFSPDGKKAASASEDHTIIIWDWERARKEAVLAAHTGIVTSIAFSSDGKTLVAGDLDGVIILWDLAERRPVWTAQNDLGQVHRVAFSPDRRFVASSYGVHDAADGKIIVGENEGWGAPSTIYGLSFSPDGQWLIETNYLGVVSLWDIGAWKLAAKQRNDTEIYLLSTAYVYAVFSPDSRQFALGTDQGEIQLWEVSPFKQVATLGHHQARVKSLQFSPDGKELASASDDQTIAVWDVKRRAFITNIGTYTAPVLAVAFSPDGRHLASGGRDRSVRIHTRRRTLWGYRID